MINENILDTTFLNICKKLKIIDKQLNDKFIRLSTNFDRFRFIWSLGFVHAEIDAIFTNRQKQQRGQYFEPKDAAKAFEFRKLGNEHFVAKRYEEALLNYNESIRYAPRVLDSEDGMDNDLALSYANRSAVFFHMNEYRSSLSDIDRALKFGYPKHLRHKLVERKLNCLMRLEWFQEALSFLNLESEQNFKREIKEHIKEARKLIVRIFRYFFFNCCFK